MTFRVPAFRTPASRNSAFRSPRWLRLYYVLAAFDLFAVCLGLYVSHSLMAIYSDSVAVNQQWAERAQAYSGLARLAAAVNAPGNDVFQSRDPGAESERMWAARRAFDNRLGELREELRANVGAAQAEPLLARLHAVRSALSAMTREARLTFSYFHEREPQRAAQRMAEMDERYAEVHADLAALQQDIARIQSENFERQGADARRQQRYEFLIGALILVMVAGATLYGRRMARHIEAEAEEKERNLADIVQARAALQETNDGLQALFRRTLDLHEDERRHIARELHEEVAQMVAALKLRLDSLGLASARAARVRVHAQNAGSIAESALHRLQGLVSDLAPHGMDLVGLAGVLPDHLREWTRGSGLAVHFDSRPGDVRPPYKIETAAYRIAEEAVRNATRHALARTLRVALLQTDQALQIHVVDDGVGFEVETRRPLSGNGMLGITLMEQRALLAGGALSITSRRGGGTVVTASFPMA